MEYKEVLIEVENCISRAELGKGIKKLLDYLNSCEDLDSEEMKGDLLLLSAQYSFYEKNILNGICSEEEKYLRFNKINHQFLSIFRSIQSSVNLRSNKTNTTKNHNIEFVSIELTLNKNINEFSIIEQNLLFDKIKTALSLGNNLKITNIVIGSIIITIELPKNKVTDLIEVVQGQDFKYFEITKIKTYYNVFTPIKIHKDQEINKGSKSNKLNSNRSETTDIFTTPRYQSDTKLNTYAAKANDSVVITDPSPVIILFGAGASGKTMILIRLTRYLIEQGYKVLPEKTFRDTRDTHYQEMCDNFKSIIVYNTKAPGQNQFIDFMLVKVMDESGRPICQLLEAPGDHYFDPKAPLAPFPVYINTISLSANRKTWVFIVEKDWMNQSDRNNFAQKIIDLQQHYVSTQDKVIFICNKADLHGEYMSGGQYNIPLFFNDIANQYPNIFSKRINTNPISKFWQKYNFDFVVFSAGSFNDDGYGGQNYIPSTQRNPALLWKSILKTIAVN